ncbi:MAG TPA: hypothetical protein VIN59_08200 [Alphaproteobacteria bacterium]
MKALNRSLVAAAFTMAAFPAFAQADTTPSPDQSLAEWCKQNASCLAWKHIAGGVLSGGVGVLGIAATGATEGLAAPITLPATAISLSFSTAEFLLGATALGLAAVGDERDSLALSRGMTDGLEVGQNALTYSGAAILLFGSVMGADNKQTMDSISKAAEYEHYVMAVKDLRESMEELAGHLAQNAGKSVLAQDWAQFAHATWEVTSTFTKATWDLFKPRTKPENPISPDFPDIIDDVTIDDPKDDPNNVQILPHDDGPINDPTITVDPPIEIPDEITDPPPPPNNDNKGGPGSYNCVPDFFQTGPVPENVVYYFNAQVQPRIIRVVNRVDRCPPGMHEVPR